MAVKKVLLQVRILTRTCTLQEGFLPLLVRDEVNLSAFKNFIGHDVEGYFYTDNGEQVSVFGMLEHVFSIVRVEEKPSQARQIRQAKGQTPCFVKP